MLRLPRQTAQVELSHLGFYPPCFSRSLLPNGGHSAASSRCSVHGQQPTFVSVTKFSRYSDRCWGEPRSERPTDQAMSSIQLINLGSPADRPLPRLRLLTRQGERVDVRERGGGEEWERRKEKAGTAVYLESVDSSEWETPRATREQLCLVSLLYLLTLSSGTDGMRGRCRGRRREDRQTL